MDSSINEKFIQHCLANMPSLFGAKEKGKTEPNLEKDRPDLFFRTQHDKKLYVELKIAPLDPRALKQLNRYNRLIHENEDRWDTKIMILAPRFSEDDTFFLKRENIEKRRITWEVQGSLILDFRYFRIDQTCAETMRITIELPTYYPIITKLCKEYPNHYKQIMKQLGAKPTRPNNPPEEMGKWVTDQQELLTASLFMYTGLIDPTATSENFTRPPDMDYHSIVLRDDQDQKLFVIVTGTPFGQNLDQINRYYCYIRDNEDQDTRFQVIAPGLTDYAADFLSRHNIEMKTLDSYLKGMLRLDVSITLDAYMLDSKTEKLSRSIDIPIDLFDELLTDQYWSTSTLELCGVKHTLSLKFAYQIAEASREGLRIEIDLPDSSINRLQTIYPDLYNHLIMGSELPQTDTRNEPRHEMRSSKSSDLNELLTACIAMDSDILETGLDFLDYTYLKHPDSKFSTTHQGLLFRDGHGKKLYVYTMIAHIQETNLDQIKAYCQIRENTDRLMILAPQSYDPEAVAFLKSHNIEMKTLEFSIEGTLRRDVTITLESDTIIMRRSIELLYDLNVLDELLTDLDLMSHLDAGILSDQLHEK